LGAAQYLLPQFPFIKLLSRLQKYLLQFKLMLFL
jgi:hypothetical protein